MPTEVINPYIDIPILPLEDKTNTRYGSDYFRDINELQVGMGSTVMRVDQSGLWLGAERFADAPFSVDMNGNVTATSLTLASLGGSLDDIADGSTYKRTTVNQVFGADYGYLGLNSSGEIIKGFLNSQLSSKSLPTNGVRVDSSGIYGRKAGVTTFYIDPSGNAYFTGDLASSTMTASTITGSTITGTTLSTATSGQRVVLFSTLASYYDSSNTLVASTYGLSNAFYIKGEQSGSNIYLDAGTTGTIAFLTNGSLRALFNYNGGYFAPYTTGSISLGTYSARWDELHNDGDHVYQSIVQPVTYFGYVSSGGSMSGDNTSWSSSNTATGRYTVTHNLGHTNYAVQAIVQASVVKNCSIESYSSSTFVVRIANLADALENNAFFFTVFEYPQ